MGSAEHAQSATKYAEKALMPFFERLIGTELPEGTTFLGPKVTPTEVIVVVCVPHQFKEIV